MRRSFRTRYADDSEDDDAPARKVLRGPRRTFPPAVRPPSCQTDSSRRLRLSATSLIGMRCTCISETFCFRTQRGRVQEEEQVRPWDDATVEAFYAAIEDEGPDNWHRVRVRSAAVRPAGARLVSGTRGSRPNSPCPDRWQPRCPGETTRLARLSTSFTRCASDDAASRTASRTLSTALRQILNPRLRLPKEYLSKPGCTLKGLKDRARELQRANRVRSYSRGAFRTRLAPYARLLHLGTAGDSS